MDVLQIFANDLAITGAVILIKKLDTLSGPKERFGFSKSTANQKKTPQIPICLQTAATSAPPPETQKPQAPRTEISVMILNVNRELT